MLCFVALCSSKTQCTGPIGTTQKTTNIPQLKDSLFAAKVVQMLQNTKQYWGANVASACGTVIVKPIFTCDDKCIPDNRYPDKDLCLCPDGYLACPYTYVYCPCGNGKPVCAADPFYCTLYCNYSPSGSWVPASVAKNLCPLDPDTINFQEASTVFPGWSFGTLNGRLLLQTDVDRMVEAPMADAEAVGGSLEEPFAFGASAAAVAAALPEAAKLQSGGVGSETAKEVLAAAGEEDHGGGEANSGFARHEMSRYTAKKSSSSSSSGNEGSSSSGGAGSSSSGGGSSAGSSSGGSAGSSRSSRNHQVDEGDYRASSILDLFIPPQPDTASYAVQDGSVEERGDGEGGHYAMEEGRSSSSRSSRHGGFDDSSGSGVDTSSSSESDMSFRVATRSVS